MARGLSPGHGSKGQVSRAQRGAGVVSGNRRVGAARRRDPGADPSADAFVDRFGTDTGNASAATGAPCTLGQVLLTASFSRTAGGVPAKGQLLPISQNAALFSLLGTTYGGDGKVTFALPDLRAIAPSHMTYSICVAGTFPDAA